MINFVVNNPPLLQKFLNRFNDTFTKHAFLSFSFYVSGLFLQLKRTSIQSITANTIYANYENIQYFISEARWDEQQLNNHRVHILQSNRTTKSSKKGVLVIDDTGCKKWGYKTEGVKVQHYGTERIETKCNVVVVSAYADPLKRYPINLKPYKPKEEFFLGKDDLDFKSKHQFAKELIDDAISKNISFSDIVFDNWYFSNDLIEYIQDNHLLFITESESTRLISFKGKWVHADELVKLIPIDRFKWVTVPSPSKENKSFYAYSFTSKLKDLPGKFLIVVAIGKWNKDDPKDVHIFVSNHLSYSSTQIISKYALRWSIECIFRDLKENVAFDHYQVRSLKSISRHWHLACLAYSFLLISKLNGSFSRIFNHKPAGCGEQLLLFRKINSMHHAYWIKKNYEDYQNYLGLKNSLRQAA
ncbi:MAG: IS701 family transposase [Elusimicrobiota bacterium]